MGFGKALLVEGISDERYEGWEELLVKDREKNIPCIVKNLCKGPVVDGSTRAWEFAKKPVWLKDRNCRGTWPLNVPNERGLER